MPRTTLLSLTLPLLALQVNSKLGYLFPTLTNESWTPRFSLFSLIHGTMVQNSLSIQLPQVRMPALGQSFPDFSCLIPGKTIEHYDFRILL